MTHVPEQGPKSQNLDCTVQINDGSQKAEESLWINRPRRFWLGARTSSAKWSRRRRSDRAETRQRLGAPSLGSGKLQTPPNRYQPARLLTPLRGAGPA